MISAILSDIHSNLEALERCVEHARAHSAKRFICLGDCVGYGADPEATMRLLMSLPGLIAVRGNHDEALEQDLGTAVPAAIRAASRWTHERLSAAQREFLRTLPYLHAEDSATYVHASAHEPRRWSYLRTDMQIADCLAAAKTPLTFIGHVHVPSVWCETPGGEIRELTPLSGERIPLSRRLRYVINVGSVGQPRDGNNGACYVLFDDSHWALTFYRLAYNFMSAADKIRSAALDPDFAARLAEGR